MLSTPVVFDPRTASRSFTLAFDDIFAVTLLPTLLTLIRAEAPGVDLSIRSPMMGKRGGMVELGDADLELTPGLPSIPGLKCAKVMHIGYLVAVRRGHPEVEQMDLDTYCRLPHAQISLTGAGPSAVDRVLSELGRSRRVQLRVRSFTAAPLLAAQSDLVMTGPRNLLELAAKTEHLRLFQPPLPLPEVTVYLAWHAATQADPSHIWLRSICRRAIQRVETLASEQEGVGTQKGGRAKEFTPGLG